MVLHSSPLRLVQILDCPKHSSQPLLKHTTQFQIEGRGMVQGTKKIVTTFWTFFDLKPTKYAKCVDKIGVDSSYVGCVRIFRKVWKISNMLEKNYFCNFSFKKIWKFLEINIYIYIFGDFLFNMKKKICWTIFGKFLDHTYMPNFPNHILTKKTTP